MKMNRTRTHFVAALAGIVLLAAYYIAGLHVPIPGAEDNALSRIGSATVILLNGIGLLLTSHRISLKATYSVPFIYIALVAINPWALRWSAFHPASLLMLASIFFYLLYCAVRPSLVYLVSSFFLLGAAGLFVPPLLWLFPFFLVLNIGRTDTKGKYLVTAFIGLALPLLIRASVLYLRYGVDAALALPGELWEGMLDLHPGLHPYSAITLARILLIVAATLMAVVHIIMDLDTYKTSQSLAFIRLIVLAALFSLMSLLFPPAAHTPCGLIICLPVTLLLNEYFVTTGMRKQKMAIATVAMLLLLAERISQFL